MKTWKRNAIIAAALMLVCGGIYLNWRFGDAAKTPLVETLDEEKLLDDATLVIAPQEGTLEALAEEGAQPDLHDTFAQMRLSRQESRDSALELLQETIAYADGTEDAMASTEQLNRIVRMALTEAQIESLVISKGYADCVAYMTDDGISLAVPASPEGLSEADVALLTDLITAQSDYALSQIRIIEVN